MSSWYLYLVRCADGKLYTGISTDVLRRLEEHRSGCGARYLRGRGPLRLERDFAVASRSEATALELRVKRLSRRDKEKLIRGELQLSDLLSGKIERSGLPA